MTPIQFRAVFYCDGMSAVHDLISDLEQVAYITSVHNNVGPTTSTVIVSFADGRVTRIVYRRTLVDRLMGRTVA